jgi:hypothetical protein
VEPEKELEEVEVLKLWVRRKRRQVISVEIVTCSNTGEKLVEVEVLRCMVYGLLRQSEDKLVVVKVLAFEFVGSQKRRQIGVYRGCHL